MTAARKSRPEPAPAAEFIPCSVRTFAAADDILAAAEHAATVNPQNAPARPSAVLMAGAMSAPLPPLAIALLTTKFWGPAPRTLTVQFLETTQKPLRDRILEHANAWKCGITFRYTTGAGDIRLSRGMGGYWAYLGTDHRLIPPGQQTMNLQMFTMATPESEYKRVVRHEFGHALGFAHEHMTRELVARLDPARTVAYFEQTQGWSAEMVEAQVLTPLDDATLYRTPADALSVMCYQLPGSITVDGRPIQGGTDINRTDRAFCRQVYPPPPAGRDLA